MTKVLLLTICLFSLTNTLQSQTWRRVGGWGNEFTGISWVNDEVGFLSGDRIILKTVDGGLSWSEQAAPDDVVMNGLDFFNQNVGLMVGENGIVYKTINAGSTWTRIKINTSTTLRKVKFVTQNRVFAVGDNGQLYRSTNGGDSWARQDVGTTANLSSIYFATLDTGYIALHDGRLLRTSNQGNNWIILNTPNAQPLNDVYFSNGRDGYAVGNRGTILKTTNAGSSWTVINSGTERDLLAVHFNKTNPNLGVVVGQSATLLRTTNAGLTFDGINVNNTQTYKDVRFRGNSNMVFTVGTSGHMLTSTNSGGSWTLRLSGNSADYIAAKFRTENLGYFVGPAGKIFSTSNGGSSIVDRSRPLSIDFHNLYFVTNALGFVVGEQGTVLRTSNSGGNWSSLNTNTIVNLRGVYFSNNNTGYVVGESGFISKTENNGVNWQMVDASNTTANLNQVLFFENSIGLIVGEGGQISRSENGQFWTTVNSPINTHLVDLARLDEQSAIAVGNQGTIIKTTDQGLTWNSINSSFQVDFTGVDFLDESVGFITGSKGLILKTMDGGETWTKMQTGTFQNFKDVSFGSLSIGYAVGDQGTLFQYSCAVPVTPTVIFGESNICISQQIYTVQNSNTPGETFEWRVDGGTILEGQGSNRIVVNWNSPGRNAVLVRGQNACGNGGTKGLEVLVSVQPQALPEISGEGTVCLGSTTSYEVIDIPGTDYVWVASGGLIRGGQGTSRVNVEWTTTGDRSLQVSPRNPCGNAPATIKPISIQSPPEQPSAISGSDLVGLVEEEYEVALTPGVNYTWAISNSGGAIISGQGSNKVKVRWQREGDFDLTATPMNACHTGTPASLKVNVNLITSITEEKSQNIAIKVYPNPSKGDVKINTSGLGAIIKISLVNSLGQIIREISPDEGDSNFEIKNLPRGVHSISVRTRDNEFFRKVVIQ
ncbi:YCF48-related protein [Belliella kenyensis]|uniref:YCF48-related protein n=1 Tax=Belliella kenyensis TaxID=1472724 RepID=A0ABV8ESK1_9BACT|nr:YCF48-related protein [Belliella kenyensis]MCH7402625.1 YCF48-related protein [Belliella kenyensis]MDN3603423.1 YCF48-related protein [Belliella kenyensis]